MCFNHIYSIKKEDLPKPIHQIPRVLEKMGNALVASHLNEGKFTALPPHGR